MSAAADAEDKTEKSIVTPGPLAPARELYGAMLLERGQARDALAAFEAALVKEPNRFNGLAGAAKAAEALGDTAEGQGVLREAARARERQQCQPARTDDCASVRRRSLTEEMLVTVQSSCRM